jgi:hypothetical protein
VVTLRFFDGADVDLGRRASVRIPTASRSWNTLRLGGYPPVGTRRIMLTLEAVNETTDRQPGDGTTRNVAFDGFSARLVFFDVDSDGLADDWEERFGFDIEVDDSALQSDGDTLDNITEFMLGTNPTMADTDGDGVNDDVELDDETDPLNPNSGLFVELPIEFVSFNFATDGNLEVTFSGLDVRLTYQLTRSLDLEDFDEVVDTFQPANSTDFFLDPDPPEEKAFYRLQSVAPN